MAQNYSIRINKTGRYVYNCDACWYDTTETPLRTFSKEEALRIAETLKKHYVYDVTVSDGARDVIHIKREKKESPLEGEFYL